MHGLSPFSNKFVIKFWQNISVLELHFVDVLKVRVLSFLVFLHFGSFLCSITVSV